MYEKIFGTHRPGLCIILLDQSGSMDEPFGESTKKEIAAMAVNEVIFEIGIRCQVSDKIKRRWYVRVIGYGGTISHIAGGWIDEIFESIDFIVKKKVSDGVGGIVEIEIPGWVKPIAEKGTPMDQAFDEAYELTSIWVNDHPDYFPPVIINITGGQPDNPEKTRQSALRLLQLGTSDGKVLLFNAYVENTLTSEILYPNDPNILPDGCARFLYDISSPLPDRLIQNSAIYSEIPIQPGARGFISNAEPGKFLRLFNFNTDERTYNSYINSHHPGIFIILLDQSGSMAKPFGGSTKKEIAAMAVNRVIYEVIRECMGDRGEVKRRWFIGVIGYGLTVKPVIGRMIDEFETPTKTKRVKKKAFDGAGGLTEIETDMPIWVEPEAENGTPMDQAFDIAYQLASTWIGDHPDHFPPVIINITDGWPDNPEKAHKAALRLLQLGTSDGRVLLFNAYIECTLTGEILYPNDPNILPDQFARFLYDISSPLPDRLIQNNAKWSGITIQPGARGFISNAEPELFLRLINFDPDSKYIFRDK